MKKIKIVANWSSSQNLVNRLIKQFKTPDIDLSKVEFVYDESYDIIVFFNYVNSVINKNSKAYIFPVEPSWTGVHQKNIPDNVTIFGFNESLYNQNCVVSVAHTFYGGRGEWVDSLDFWNYEHLKNFNSKKIKNISSSITKLNSNNGSSCLYPHRVKILNEVKKTNFIDIFDGTINSCRHEALINYKFNLVIENEYIDNWITEKFYDAILTNTIPIYFGCKNIKEIYPEDGYILLEDINNTDLIINQLDYINKNADRIYTEKLTGLKKIKENYFNNNNLLKKIINL